MADMFTGDVSVMDLDTLDLQYRFENATIRLETEKQGARPAKRSWTRNVGRITTLTWEFTVDLDDTETPSGSLLALHNADKPFSVTTGPPGSGAATYSGVCHIFAQTQGLPNSGPQTMQITAESVDEVTLGSA